MPKSRSAKRSPRAPKARKIARTQMGAALKYESNRKHKEPWQPGRKGSLCPSDMTAEIVGELLKTSELHEGKRFAVYGGQAYRGSEHALGRWHGFPVGWKEVPPKLRVKWLTEARVSRTDIRRYWD